MNYKLVFCILFLQQLLSAHSRTLCRERSLQRDDPNYISPVRLNLQCSSTHANLTIHSTDSALAAGDTSVTSIYIDLICTRIPDSNIVYTDSVTLNVNPVNGGFHPWSLPEGYQSCTVESCIEELNPFVFRFHHLNIDIARDCEDNHYTSSAVGLIPSSALSSIEITSTIHSSSMLSFSQNSIIHNTILPSSFIQVEQHSSYSTTITSTISEDTSTASISATPTQQVDDFDTIGNDFPLGIDSNLLISIMTIAVIFFIVISVCLVMGAIVFKTLIVRKRRKQLEDGEIMMEHKIDLVTLSASPSLVTIYHDQLVSDQWLQQYGMSRYMSQQGITNSINNSNGNDCIVKPSLIIVGGKDTIKTSLGN